MSKERFDEIEAETRRRKSYDCLTVAHCSGADRPGASGWWSVRVALVDGELLLDEDSLAVARESATDAKIAGVVERCRELLSEVRDCRGVRVGP